MKRSSARPLVASLLGLVAVAVASAASSCAQPQSSLASNDDNGSSGSGGASGAGGAPGSGGKAGSAASSGSPSGFGGQAGSTMLPDASFDGAQDAAADLYDPDVAPDVFIDPDGQPELRVMNGVTDKASVRFCLQPWKDGAPSGPALPFPLDPLSFGQHSLAETPSGFDPASDEIRPLVLSGQPGAVDCATLLTAPPTGVKVAALPVLPAGTLSAPRSLLLVAGGCLGGTTGQPAVPDPDYACGQGVKADVGNARLFLVELSRKAPPADAVGIQILHASAAMGPLEVRAEPSGELTPVPLVKSLSPGQIAPRPPAAYTLDALYGFAPMSSQLHVYDTQQGKDFGVFAVGAGLEASGLAPDAVLAPGIGLVAVIVGSRPGSLSDASMAHPARLVWLKAPGL